jgi:hypothetical protein
VSITSVLLVAHHCVDHAGIWLDPQAVVSLVAVAPTIDDDPKDTPLFYFSPIHTVRLYLARQPRDVYVYLGKALAHRFVW